MSRRAPDDLSRLFDAVAVDPTAWELFALIRAIEAVRPDAPPVGTALDPALELVDLAHLPSAGFPRTTVAELKRAKRRPVIRSQHLGLTGPMGPLPNHLTEIAIFERRIKGPTPFADFLDLVSSRMLQSFYRAWADANPCAQADRPANDQFAARLGATSGATDLRFVSAAERPPHDSEGFNDWRRLAYGGHLAALKSAAAIADLFGHLLERPVTVFEGVGRWHIIPHDARTRIGRTGAHNRLGIGATLGKRFFAVEWNVAFAVRARSMDDLTDFLPGGLANTLLSEAAETVLPQHLQWDAWIEIGEAQIAPARLGTMRLGHTSWVAPGKKTCVRSDLRLGGRKPVRRAA